MWHYWIDDKDVSCVLDAQWNVLETLLKELLADRADKPLKFWFPVHVRVAQKNGEDGATKEMLERTHSHIV